MKFITIIFITTVMTLLGGCATTEKFNSVAQVRIDFPSAVQLYKDNYELYRQEDDFFTDGENALLARGHGRIVQGFDEIQHLTTIEDADFVTGYARFLQGWARVSEGIMLINGVLQSRYDDMDREYQLIVTDAYDEFKRLDNLVYEMKPQQGSGVDYAALSNLALSLTKLAVAFK